MQYFAGFIVPALSHLPSSHLCRPELSGNDENASDEDASPHSGDGNSEHEFDNVEANVGGGGVKGSDESEGCKIQAAEKDGFGSKILVNPEFQVASWQRDDEQMEGGYSGMQDDEMSDEMGGEMGYKSGNGVGDGDMGVGWMGEDDVGMIGGDMGDDWMRKEDIAMNDGEGENQEDIGVSNAGGVKGSPAVQEHPAKASAFHGAHSSLSHWPGDADYEQLKLQGSPMGKFGNLQLGSNHYCTTPGEEQLSQLQVPRTSGFSRLVDHHAIPLDTDAILKHYGTPRKEKKGHTGADSPDSRQSKVTCRSASHSTAPVHSTMVSTDAQSPSSAIPSTRLSTSRNVSPVNEQDLHGASCTTGGVFRGRALGNNPNWTDSTYKNVYDASSKPMGKVLLYTS